MTISTKHDLNPQSQETLANLVEIIKQYEDGRKERAGHERETIKTMIEMRISIEELNKKISASVDSQDRSHEYIMSEIGRMVGEVEKMNVQNIKEILGQLKLHHERNLQGHFRRIAIWGAIQLFVTLHHDALVFIGIAFFSQMLPIDTIQKMGAAWVAGIGATLIFVFKQKMAQKMSNTNQQNNVGVGNG